MGRLINTDDLKRVFGFCRALWYSDDEPKLYEHLVETIIDNCPTAKQPECEYMKALHELEDKVASLESEIRDFYYEKSNER